ncbi:hypothetical protein CI238_05136 [Colletotrichum incanum]|uniref:Kinesin light chain n=1 Tax=Colletotrichum incanum TaxID=1573173 RepID=A0A161XWW1_COLIC|nr:hypothetical protein CI238_05136 [Colletotrichum incanum]
MTGPNALLVTKSSATHCRPWEDGPEHICAINRSHSNIVKFEKEDDEYEKTLQRLTCLSKRAVGVRSLVQDSNVKFLVPYNQNTDFVGRSTILDQVKARFNLTQSRTEVVRQSRVSLFGLGGVGETYSDMSVFWVHASNADRFRQSFNSIAEEYGIPRYDDPQSDVPMLVRKWLQREDLGRWIMVIDNADETELFFPSQQRRAQIDAVKYGLGLYVPECSEGLILVTTRNKETALKLAQGRPPVQVECMSSSEAHQLLRERVGDVEISADDTALLATRLENLPLALAQASAFIQEKSMPIKKYIRCLDESDSALVSRLSKPFGTVGRDDETPHAVTATWMVSFEQIQRQHVFASEVLSFISAMDHQAIPERFVADYYRQTRPGNSKTLEEDEVDEALGCLKGFCFISEAEAETVDMHWLVQLVTRKWMVDKGIMDGFAQQALQIASKAYPYGRHETREVCLQYLPHALAVLEARETNPKNQRDAKASLSHSLRVYYSYRAQWMDAERHQLQALKIRKMSLREEHPDTLSSMSDLASTLSNQGRWEEAEELEVQTMNIRLRVLGEEHVDILISIGNLRSTLRKQGRWREAERLEVQALTARKRILGEKHPHTLISIGNLALTYKKQGRWKEAEQLEVKVMETRKRILGEEHPDTITSMKNLADTLTSQGRSHDALVLFQDGAVLA